MNSLITANGISQQSGPGTITAGEAYWQEKYQEARQECHGLREKIARLERDHRVMENALQHYLSEEAKAGPRFDHSYEEAMKLAKAYPSFDEFMDQIRTGV